MAFTTVLETIAQSRTREGYGLNVTLSIRPKKDPITAPIITAIS